LSQSESPYLLQHSHNPVNWYPHEDAAFKIAKEENRLIFLSIGYSTCHWCHVMEKESFEVENVAKLLNKDYISIKVDKEEMPQIDIYYQHKHSLLKKGRNGWPLTIILTPKKEILYIATYVPAEDNYGIEGLKNLLPRMADLYHKNPKQIEQILAANKKLILEKDVLKEIKVDGNLSTLFVQKMTKRYDRVYKGFDRRPRFPMASHLNVLLQIYLLDGDKNAYKMVEETLDAMANGGIYDQIEGGFFRYTTDQDWIIPHYEKMLYTNAELIPIYVKMYQLTGKSHYKKVVNETIKEFKEKFQQNHLFFAASDADSIGGEGRYFVYTLNEVVPLLKKEGYSTEEIEENLEYFDITEIGNFKGDLSNVHFNTGFDEPVKRVEETKKILLKLRKKKEFPFIDQKIITAWNAMMIKSLFIAARIDEKYKKMAEDSLQSLLDKLYIDGVLYHQLIGTKAPSKLALLEDYSFLIDTLLTAYQSNFKTEYLTLATKLAYESIDKFYDKGTWYLNDDNFKVRSVYNDKYYTTALSRHFNNLLSIANLNYDLKLLMSSKKYIQDEKQKILNNMGKSPEAVLALIRIGQEDIVLKSNKKKLLDSHKQIDKIRYPFLLKKSEKADIFLLCNESTCFFYDKNLTKVIDKIERKK
jgi:uncharacterized protein YyaL (SSP411 family)